MPAPQALAFTNNEDANQLLATDSLAVLIGMLLDQQVPMEFAFRSPYLLKQRLGELDAGAIAAMEPKELEDIFRERPALHRFPGTMAKRTQALCQTIVDEYDSTPENIWMTAKDGTELYGRLRALPGFGEAKARIFVALLGRRLGTAPPGWEVEAATWPCIADVDTFDKIEKIRSKKRAMKAKARS